MQHIPARVPRQRARNAPATRPQRAAKARVPELAAVAHLRVRAAARLNNQVEQSHQPTRLRECVMRRFKSVASAQRFLTAFSGFCNHFGIRRHLLTAGAHRTVRQTRYAAWCEVVGAARGATAA